MKDIHIFESVEQVQLVLSNTRRYRVLDLLVSKAMTGSQLSRALKIPRQLAHYHLKLLVEGGLAVLEKEIIHQGKVEKYYRAVARSFSAGAILGVEQRRSEGPEMLRKKTESIKEVSLTFLEQAKMDLQQEDASLKMDRFHLPFQKGVMLTEDQETMIAEKLYAIYNEVISLSDQNLEKNDRTGMLGIRYTLLFTPLESLAELDEQDDSGA